jgi:hypothetical protein
VFTPSEQFRRLSVVYGAQRTVDQALVLIEAQLHNPVPAQFGTDRHRGEPREEPRWSMNTIVGNSILFVFTLVFIIRDE